MVNRGAVAINHVERDGLVDVMCRKLPLGLFAKAIKVIHKGVEQATIGSLRDTTVDTPIFMVEDQTAGTLESLALLGEIKLVAMKLSKVFDNLWVNLSLSSWGRHRVGYKQASRKVIKVSVRREPVVWKY